MFGYRVMWTVQIEAHAASPREAAIAALKEYRYNPQSIGQVVVEDEHGSHEIAISGFPHFMLTNRQSEVLRWIVLGYDNASIASELGLTTRSIKAHVAGLLRKLGVRNRVQLAVAAGKFDGQKEAERDMSRYQAALDALGAKRKRIAELVKNGLTNREIAEQMRTTEAMVKQYLMQVYNALGVSSRLELANWMLTLEHDDFAQPWEVIANNTVPAPRTRRCLRSSAAREALLMPLPGEKAKARSGAGNGPLPQVQGRPGSLAWTRSA